MASDNFLEYRTGNGILRDGSVILHRVPGSFLVDRGDDDDTGSE